MTKTLAQNFHVVVLKGKMPGLYEIKVVNETIPCKVSIKKYKFR